MYLNKYIVKLLGRVFGNGQVVAKEVFARGAGVGHFRNFSHETGTGFFGTHSVGAAPRTGIHALQPWLGPVDEASADKISADSVIFPNNLTLFLASGNSPLLNEMRFWFDQGSSCSVPVLKNILLKTKFVSFYTYKMLWYLKYDAGIWS